MNTKTKTIIKSVVIVLILLAFVFALRAPAADLPAIPSELKADYFDSSGLPYFSEMDSYYNLRMTQDYIDHGYYGDTLVNNTQIDNHRFSPYGANTTYKMGIGLTTSWMYQLSQLFGDFDVKTVAFWTGAIISCLAVIPTYAIVRRVTNDYGAITASLLIALSPNYFAHTFPGFFDTDMFIFIFPLFTILFFIECIRTEKRIYKILFAILAVLSIMAFAESWDGYVFYIAMLGLFVVVYLLLNLYLSIKDSTKDTSMGGKIKEFILQREVLSIIALVVLLLIALTLVDSSGVLGIVGNVLGGFNLQSTTSATGFPNVGISVAELQVPSLVSGGIDGAFLADTSAAINGIGGITCLFAALIVLYIYVSRLFSLRKTTTSKTSSGKLPKNLRQSTSKKTDDKRFNFSLREIGEFGSQDEIVKSRKENLLYLTLFVVWTVSAAIAVTQGARFITLLILPFGILTGIFVGYAADYIKAKRIDDKKLIALIVIAIIIGSYPIIVQVDRTFGLILLAAVIVIAAILYQLKKPLVYKDIPFTKYLAIFCIFLAIVSPTVCFANYTVNPMAPSFQDSMWESMEWINQNQANDTVISSWWDFGYLFEIAADRQTVFDGGMQGSEGRAYWLGHAMTTDDLELSAGIFRMLGTTGYDPIYDKLVPYTNGSNGTTVKILNEILPESKSDAKNTLMNDYKVSAVDSDEIVKMTHPDNPRPVTFVASSDMLVKAGWWTYFGNWKFDGDETEAYSYYVSTEQAEINKTGQSGVVPLHSEYGLNFTVNITRGSANNTDAQVNCNFESNGSKVFVNDTEYNPLKAGHILVVEDGYLVRNDTLKNATDCNFTLYVIGYNGTYTAILMSDELVDSMFTRLYLLGGYGQDVFTQVHMGNGISLWQVNFENTVAGGRAASTGTEVSNSTSNSTDSSNGTSS